MFAQRIAMRLKGGAAEAPLPDRKPVLVERAPMRVEMKAAPQEAPALLHAPQEAKAVPAAVSGADNVPAAPPIFSRC